MVVPKGLLIKFGCLPQSP